MLKRIFFLIISILVSSVCFAFDSTKEAITFSGITMPYRKCVINGTDEAAKPSLVVYLHGGSSKGNDNETQLQEPGTDSIANYLEASGRSAIFLIPQCPSNMSWGGPMNNVLKAMIDRYVNAGAVNADCIYIFGGSMGGTGTWGMLSAFPDLFAAAMPVAGNPSKCLAENVSKTPVFTVMGTADNIMSVNAAQTFINNLQALGDDVCMEVEDGWTHEMTCIESYTKRRLDWIFAHERGMTSAIRPVSVQHETVVESLYYTLDGRPVKNPSSSHVYLRKEVLSDGRVEVKKICH